MIAPRISPKHSDSSIESQGSLWDHFVCPGIDVKEAANLETDIFPPRIDAAHSCCPRASTLSHFSDFVPKDDDLNDPNSRRVRISRPRTVSFSQFTEGTFIPLEEDEVSSKWYTASEEIQLRLTRQRDVHRLLREIHNAQANAPITQDQILHCVGIEDLVTDGLAEHVEETRITHVEAVLLEQDVQRVRGITDPDRLSKISRMRSRWARERARKLAVGYCNFLDD